MKLLIEQLIGFARSLGLDDLLGQGWAEQALLEAQMEAGRIALEAATAEARGVPLRDAVLDEANYPRLALIHTCVKDILTQELPPEVRVFIAQAFSPDALALSEEFNRSLASLAADQHAGRTERAFAEFLLFEGVRASLLVAEHFAMGSVPALAPSPRDMDEVAEEQVKTWLLWAADIEDDVRPLPVLVSAGLHRLQERMNEKVALLLRAVGEDFIKAARTRAKLDAKLRAMNASDAVLIENYFAAALDEQPLSIKRLQMKHPLALGERNRAAIDKQMSRLVKRVENDDWPKRRRPALIDVLMELEESS